jgi:hypothetical protein
VGPACQRQPTSARSPSLSLPLSGGADLSAPTLLARAPRRLSVPRAPRISVGRPFARPLSLVRGPCLLDLSLPTIRSHDLRPRCTPRSRPPPPRSFLAPAPTPASLPSLAPTAELPHSPHVARASEDIAAVRRNPMCVLWSPSSPRCVCCLGELCLVTSDLGHPSVRSLTIYFPRSMLTDPFSTPQQLHRRRPEASPCPCRRSKVPVLSLKVTNLTLPLIFPSLPLSMSNQSRT